MGEKSSQIGFRIDEETREIIEEELDYGDHISEWVRVAIEERIEREGLAGNQTQMMTAD